MEKKTNGKEILQVPVLHSQQLETKELILQYLCFVQVYSLQQECPVYWGC